MIFLLSFGFQEHTQDIALLYDICQGGGRLKTTKQSTFSDLKFAALSTAATAPHQSQHAVTTCYGRGCELMITAVAGYRLQRSFCKALIDEFSLDQREETLELFSWSVLRAGGLNGC